MLVEIYMFHHFRKSGCQESSFRKCTKIIEETTHDGWKMCKAGGEGVGGAAVVAVGGAAARGLWGRRDEIALY